MSTDVSASKEETYLLKYTSTSSNGSAACGSYSSSDLNKDLDSVGMFTFNQLVCKWNLNILAVFVSSVVACLPAFLGGCTLGFSSSALLDLDDLEQRPEYKFDLLLSDIFGTLAPIGAVVGGPIAGFISDLIGRKASLMLVGIPNLIGYLMMVYAHFSPDALTFKIILLTGRFFTGIGLGWSCVITPIYLAEISPEKLRGAFTSFTEIFISIGMLFVYLLGSFESFPYYDSALVQISVMVIFELSMLFLYETPRWLLAHSKKNDAVKALKFLRGSQYDITSEQTAIENDIAQYPKLKFSQIFREVGRRNVFIPLFIVCSVFFFQEIGGMNASFTYSAQIFKKAQVNDYRSASTYAIGGVGVLFTIVGAFIVDCIGRKMLLIVSGIGMLVGTVTLGTSFFVTRSELCTNFNVTDAFTDDNPVEFCNAHLAPLAVTGLIVFNAAFSLGWGPVPWVLLGEFLPLRVRGVGSGIATVVTWSTAAVVTGFYLEFAEAVNAWGAWWIFSALNALAILFVIFFLAETKGKSLEAIQQKFNTK